MDWQHFKDDVFNGLVSGVTVLAVLGTGGKTVFEHWFNRRLKEYEIELKKKADRGQAKLVYIFPKQVDAADEMLKMCAEIHAKFQAALQAAFNCRYDKTESSIEEMYEKTYEFGSEMESADKIFNQFKTLLPKELLDAIWNYLQSIQSIDPKEFTQNAESWESVNRSINDEYDIIHEAYQTLIGNAE